MERFTFHVALRIYAESYDEAHKLLEDIADDVRETYESDGDEEDTTPYVSTVAFQT